MGKGIKYGLLAISAILVIVALSLVLRTGGTASRMADQTIFNADKHVYSFEEFRHKYEAFKQHETLWKSATVQLKNLKADGTKSSDPEYRNLVMQKTGAFQMMNNVAKEYNAMSRIGYQAIWKGKNLPATLTVPLS